MKFKIIMSLAAAAIAIQFVPHGKSHSNPPVTSEPAWDSLSIKSTFERVCGNCHSNQTDWPWYSSVAPVSWLVQRDVDEGREHLNASEFDQHAPGDALKAAEEVRSKEMTPWFYVIGYPEAKFFDLNREDLACLAATGTTTFSGRRRFGFPLSPMPQYAITNDYLRPILPSLEIIYTQVQMQVPDAIPPLS